MKAAIYARVSTRDRGQDTENQLTQLREYARRQSWEIVEYVDHDTGKHAQREAFQQMFAAASRREFDLVLVWALDRLTREGVWETFDHIRRLSSYGVQFESLTEAHFRTTGPAGELMLAIAAWIAQQERLRISDRTKAGLDRARREGKQLGRPRKVWSQARAEKLRAAGKSWRAIAAALKVPESSLRRGFQPAPKRS